MFNDDYQYYIYIYIYIGLPQVSLRPRYYFLPQVSLRPRYYFPRLGDALLGKLLLIISYPIIHSKAI
jgi:hypothetical protein